jgi:hypothetical protein
VLDAVMVEVALGGARAEQQREQRVAVVADELAVAGDRGRPFYAVEGAANRLVLEHGEYVLLGVVPRLRELLVGLAPAVDGSAALDRRALSMGCRGIRSLLVRA